uniref:V-type ATP synthase subunit D n=1 Tax=Nitrosopumivirus cobalaminus TaxID=3158414 RepID=A0AAU7N475_9VIRU
MAMEQLKKTILKQKKETLEAMYATMRKQEE